MEGLTQRAKDQLGKAVRIETTKRGKTTVLEGVVVGVERVPGVLIYEPENDERFPAVRFHVRCPDGKYRWSGSFADKETVS